MKKQTTIKIIIGVILIVGVILFSFYSSERIEPIEQNNANATQKQVLIADELDMSGVPNPAAIYCRKLGYEYKIITNEKGGQHGVCTLPNQTECTGWNFYRGKCGQEFSYCKQQGYDLKALGKNEGWFEGAVCIDKNTKEEIDTVYNLMNMSLSKSLS